MSLGKTRIPTKTEQIDSDGWFKHDRILYDELSVAPIVFMSGWGGGCKAISWFELTLVSFGGCDFD